MKHCREITNTAYVHSEMENSVHRQKDAALCRHVASWFKKRMDEDECVDFYTVPLEDVRKLVMDLLEWKQKWSRRRAIVPDRMTIITRVIANCKAEQVRIDAALRRLN